MRKNFTRYGFDFRLRSQRRPLVIATYAGYVVLIGSLWLAHQLGSAGPIFASLAGALVAVAGWEALHAIGASYSEPQSKDAPPLDERQSQVRDRAFSRCYQVVCGLAGGWLVYDAISATSKYPLWRPVTWNHYQTIVWTFLFVAITLPNAWIAWTEPDFAEEEQSGPIAV